MHGEAQPPKCSAAEEALATSDVYDHGDQPKDRAGATWSCEAACPSGKKRVVAYEDKAPALKPLVFNGQWQKKYVYSCASECGPGGEMKRAPDSSGQGTRYSYSCYSVAEREAKQAATKKAEAQEREAGRETARLNAEDFRERQPAQHA